MNRCRFDGACAVISGASSGIGREIAAILCKKYRCRVIGLARNEERLTSAKEELKDFGEKYTVRPFDASSKENWVKLAEDLKNTDTSLDILINCAGILPKFSSQESLSDLEKVMDINFYSQVYAIDSLTPLLEKSDSGAIINFSSASALCPFGGVKSYTASKSAVENYTAALACESKLYVGCIIPGFIKTDIMKNQGASEREARLFSHVCSDLDRSVRKMVRRIKRKKSRIVVGLDARLMSLTYKLFPKRGPKLITWFLRKTGLDIFKEI